MPKIKSRDWVKYGRKIHVEWNPETNMYVGNLDGKNHVEAVTFSQIQAVLDHRAMQSPNLDAHEPDLPAVKTNYAETEWERRSELLTREIARMDAEIIEYEGQLEALKPLGDHLPVVVAARHTIEQVLVKKTETKLRLTLAQSTLYAEKT